MYDSGQRNRIRSVTEPSTPLRKSPLIDESFSFYSRRQRTIFRTSDIHLPPHELPSITAKLSQESNSAPGSLRRSRRRSRSRPTTPLGGRDLMSELSPDTSRKTYKRRSSSNFTMGNKRRKRRSLILTENGGTAFDPNYIGPITIDYLRLFCKIAIKEQTEKENTKVDIEDVEVPIESQEEVPTRSPDITDHNERKNLIYNDFDQSLPLPEVEGMPVSPDPHDVRPLYDPVDVGVSPKKKKKFSYLERILAAQAKKNPKIDKEAIIDTEPALREQSLNGTNRQIIDSSSMQTHLIIEDNSAYIKKAPSSELDVRSSTEPENNITQKKDENLFVPEDSSGIDEQLLNNKQPVDNENLLVNQQLDELPLDNEQRNNEFSNMIEDNHTNDIKNIGSLPNPNGLLESILTPTENPLEFQSLSNQEEEREREDLASPNGVVNEEYTIDNDFSHDLFEEAFDRNNEHNDIDDIDDNPIIQHDEATTRAHITRITRSDKTRREGTNMKLPINMIKNVIKSLQVAPPKGNRTTTKQMKHTQKPKRLSPEIYKFIQQKSDDFILNVVADLEAYSKHRTNNKGSQINIKDVLLYLNRIKFSTGDQNRVQDIDNITNLAYKFLPLELLISLDNNLHGRSNNQKSKSYETEDQSGSFVSDSESD